jgi:2-methylisocitrate lyase-like PEP mutase family enzyme
MISARIADGLGFDAIYMTGYGVTASHLGLPDAGLASYTEMESRARMIATGTTTPLIADADTGYGGLLNVQRTVRGYEAAGVAAIQLEDQEFPKKCGHTEGRRVISLDDMVRKIEVAVASRKDPDFLIIARTDSRTSLGLDEALRRADAYRAAGADILFVESPEDEAEFERIGQSIDAPLLANMVESGRSSVLSPERLTEFGFAIALYPGTAFMAAAHTLSQVYSHLREHGTSLDMEQPLNTLSQMNETMGFEAVWEFDKRWSET